MAKELGICQKCQTAVLDSEGSFEQHVENCKPKCRCGSEHASLQGFYSGCAGGCGLNMLTHCGLYEKATGKSWCLWCANKCTKKRDEGAYPRSYGEMHL